VQAPGQGVEPRSPRSARGVLPVRRSRNDLPSVRPRAAKVDAVAAPSSQALSRSPSANDVVQATRLTFDPGSPHCGVLRGGPLEPGALALSDNSQAKAAAYSAAYFPARAAQRNLSLLGGASQLVVAFQAGHHLSQVVEQVLKRRRRSSRIALATVLCGQKPLARIPPGEGRRITGAPLGDGLRPVRGRHGIRRFGKEPMAECRDLHRCVWR
jgi:hypothetical protein